MRRKKMFGVSRFPTRKRLLKFAADNITVDGPILEFGVWAGNSINFLAETLPSSKIYGFDSFEGLPDAWFGVGRFSRKGEPPEVRDNVELVIGWFDHVLPGFLDKHDFEKVALMHVDCDIYSSTQTVLNCLRKTVRRLSPRTRSGRPRMRFGVGMNTDHTLEEVGRQFRERICQIEAKALRKPKHPTRSGKLRSFLDNRSGGASRRRREDDSRSPGLGAPPGCRHAPLAPVGTPLATRQIGA